VTRKPTYEDLEERIRVLEEESIKYRQTENELNETLQRLNFHIENTPLAVVEFNSCYRITYWSKQAEKIFGWNAEEVIGKRIDEIRWVHEDDLHLVAELSADMIASRRTSNINTNRNYRKDGSVITCEWCNSALLNSKGELISVQSLVRDITERNRLETELQATNAKLEAALAKAAEGESILNILMENIPEGITIADAPDINIKMVSRYGREILGGKHSGMTAEEVVDQWKVYGRDGVTPVAVEDTPLSRAILKGEIVKNEGIVQINEMGQALPLLCNAAPIRDHFGLITGGIVAWRDITEIKQADEELRKYREHLETLVEERTALLRESENKYRTIFENTGTVTIIDEEDTTISLVNAEFEHVFGYTKDEVEGKKSWVDLILKEDLEQLMKYRHMRNIDPGMAPPSYELKMVDRSGRIRDFYATVAMIPGTKKRMASLVDITPLKETERALAKNQALYRNLFENASIGMFQSTFEPGSYLHVNSAYAKMLGYESPEDLMSTVTDIATIHVDPNDRATLIAALEQQDWHYAEYPRFRKDGSIMFGKVSIRRVLKSDGTIDYIEGIVEDVTELKRAEEERKKYIEEIRDLYENAPFGYHSLGEDGTVLRMNKTELEWLGYSRDEVIGKMKYSDFLIPEGKEIFQHNFPILKKQGWISNIENKLVRRDGSVLPIILNATAIYDENGKYLMSRASAFDNTERKKAEEALIKSERELRIKARNLLEVNTTMKVLLDTMEKDQEELKERFLTNVKAQVLPYLEKLKKTPLNDVQKGFIKTAEAYLDEIASPFVQKLTSNYLNLTKKEIQIAALIREGKTSKEIATLLNAKQRVIDFHRENIRKKLGLNNKKESLAILLRSFS